MDKDKSSSPQKGKSQAKERGGVPQQAPDKGGAKEAARKGGQHSHAGRGEGSRG